MRKPVKDIQNLLKILVISIIIEVMKTFKLNTLCRQLEIDKKIHR